MTTTQPNLHAIIRARYRQQDTTNFDGRRMRTTIQRKALDYSAFLIEGGTFANRIVGRVREGEVPVLRVIRLPYSDIATHARPSFSTTINLPVHNKLHHTSINKLKAPINTLSYTPDGRRLLTGNASGEFTLWNTFTHSFETIMQAHDSPIRKITFSHDGNLILSGDNNGTLKFWYLSLNNVQIRRVSETSIRDMSTGENIFVTGGDDAILRVHDYQWDRTDTTSKIDLKGHNWDIRVAQINPSTSTVLSGGKDNLVKLWDIRTAQEISTLHNHKNTILCGTWQSSNVFLTGSKDCTIREWDIRYLNQELNIYRTKKEVTCIAVRDTIDLNCANFNSYFNNYHKNHNRVNKFHNNKYNQFYNSTHTNKYFAAGQSDGTITIYCKGNNEGIDLKGNESISENEYVTIEELARECGYEFDAPQKEENRKQSLQNSNNNNNNNLNVFNEDYNKYDLLTIPHTSTVWSICFHPIGHLMASGSMDMTVKIWGWGGNIEEQEERVEEGIPGLSV